MALLVLRVFISSPGDVVEERLIARRVVGRLDAQYGDVVAIEPVYWESAPLLATATFQEQLTRPSEADVMVMILGARLGTPLPGHIRRDDGSLYASGTEFEFEDAVAGFRRHGRPQILAYRKASALPAAGDLQSLEESVVQQQALERFIARWFRDEADGSFKGAFHNFASAAAFEDLLEAHLSRLVERHLPQGRAITGRAATWRGASPFRGLEVFEAEHAPVFFGRTAAVSSVLGKLRAQARSGRRFVLIVSMSGAGKSSLARAGVLPLMLQPGVLGTATRWRHAVMRPSDGRGTLLEPLRQAIAAALAVDTTALGAEPPAALAPAVVAGLDAIDVEPDHETHLALIVDQLEEAFSDERIGPQARTDFFTALDALARCGKVWIVATMRSDTYSRLAEQPLLLALKEGDGQFDLLPPTLREIGQIIRFPASASGLRFEVRHATGERLDDLIRDDAARNPGALPLLQFLLDELYKRRSDDDVLTFRAYEDLGGVEGALAQRAEAVVARVGPEARQALRTVLRELVTFGTDDDGRALRRIAPRAAFQSKAALELVDALLDARLLVSTVDDDGHAAISLAHESLLEFWPRLRAWRDEDRELLLVKARLAAAARDWEKRARDDDLLLARGKPLAEARQLTSAGIRLSESEAALIEASSRRASRFARLRAGAVAALAVLTIVAGVAAWTANVESRRAQVQATTAQRTTDFMVSLFAVADPDESQGEKVTVREILDRGVTQIESGLDGEDSVRANLLRAMGQAYNGLGLYPKARDVLRDAVTRGERGGVPADLLKARLALAENRYQDGDYDEAERLYRAALAQAIETNGAEHDTVVRASTGLAQSLAEKNQSADAERLYREALAMSRRLHGENHIDTARALDGLGRLMAVGGRYDEAEAVYRRSLQIQRQLFGLRHSNVALALNNLGSLYFQVGRYDAAVEVWTEALPIYRGVFGAEHRYVAGISNNLGRVELLTGKLDAAETHLTEAVTIDRKVLAKGHDDLILPLNSLAMVMMARGDPDRARPLLDEARQIAEGRSHWMLNQVLGNQAELALMSGQLAEGRELLDEARRSLQKQYAAKLAGSEAWRAAVLDCTEAAYQLASQDRDRAEALLTGALPVLEQRFGPRGLFVDRATARLAALYTQTGREERAAQYRRRLLSSGSGRLPHHF